MNRKRWIVIGLIIIAALVLIGYTNRQQLTALFLRPTQSAIEQGQPNTDQIETVASNLVTPWSISFLPNGDMLVSERSGQIKRIGQDGATYPINGVRETSEGGLLGIALHPDFVQNREMYIYYTTDENGQLTNQIDKVRLKNNQLTDRQTILANIPAAANHNGGAIEFGPDGKLYVTTGDAAQVELAQDTNSLAGKILRLNDDGSAPNDNPFGNLVWSYGHRNPQGITWDDQGRLWSVEHGPSGSESGRDELNLIEKGANYGWPTISGDETKGDMKSPVVQSGDEETWAPARMVFVSGKLYFTGLRGQSLYQADTSPEKPNLKRYFTSEYGRLRAIAAHDNSLYIATSNRDGRGSAKRDDDKVIRVPLELLGEQLSPQ